MAKDKFFLRFQPLKWLSGRISFQSLELQGAFIQCVCVAFEKGNCFKSSDVDYRIKTENLEKLVMLGFVKENGENYSIDFMSDELERINEISVKRSETGKKGGRPKAKESKQNQLVFSENQNKANESKRKQIREDKIREDKNIYALFVEAFNKVRDTKFRDTDQKFRRNLDNLLKSGYMANDALTAYKNAIKDQYHIETGFKHLTPEFITRIDKLEKFLNAGKGTVKQVQALGLADGGIVP